MRTDPTQLTQVLEPTAEIVELLATCRLCPTDVCAIYQTLALFAYSF